MKLEFWFDVSWSDQSADVRFVDRLEAWGAPIARAEMQGDDVRQAALMSGKEPQIASLSFKFWIASSP